MMPATKPLSLSTAKKAAREAAKLRRDAVTLRADKSRQGCERALPLLEGHPIVAVYAAMGTEFDPRFLADALRNTGATVLYPRVSSATRVLEFCQSVPADLHPSSFGVPEPSDKLPAHPLSAISAFITPALSFDRKANRLGWGRGHYDHTLVRCPDALRIGICFHEQLTESLPCEASDQIMDWVVTDMDAFKGARRNAQGSKTPII